MLPALTVDLRPRGMSEAADLGARLVQAEGTALWRQHLLLMAGLTAVALALGTIAEWLAGTLLLLAKPAVDRVLLHRFSRAAFGERGDLGTFWALRRHALWLGLAGDLTWRRLSPWRSYLMPVNALEAQRGRAARQRRVLLLRSHRGHAFMTLQAHAWAEAALVIAAMSLLAWLQPPGADWTLAQLFEQGWINVASVLVYASAVAFVEPFYVAAGFAMYLNRRVELEAWDLEQELRHAFASA